MNLSFAVFRLSNQIGSVLAPNWTAQKAGKRFLTPTRYPIKGWEHDAEQKGSRFELREGISAIRWHPESHTGNEARRAQVLLVHGWESRATQMYGLAAGLLEQGFDVVAVDMPGHGHSAGDTANPHVFAQTIQLAEDALGRFEIVIGHSMGAGATAVAVGRGLLTSKMVLISGPSSVENVLRRFSGFVGLSKKTTDKFVAFIGRAVGVPAEALDSTLLLKHCKVPALLIHDESDVEVPASESRRLASVLEGAELFISSGLGHRKVLKSTQVMEKIASFIHREPARSAA